ncbi:SMI1/KNR4 family protein [Prosthecobacter sp.]|uniref:SMI1/KNR4 family protein n=1 Tax=Prosthecobacter sp. TaxID=1965333 RepID=UPI0024887E45|nr:SMI1/KNR4 family protein [Prosthecobacter sp.]MDI1313257.1 SMI1/KNR4 family protein [Prosthecobacter sp.]
MNWLNILTPSKVSFELAVLVALEGRLLRRLPKEYRQFIVSLNGGMVCVEHALQTRIYDEPYELGVRHIFSLNDSGVVDIQEGWRESNVGSDAVLPIADDGGTGFYFLLLDRVHWGQIYFSYKDEFFMTPSADWAAVSHGLPRCLGFVAKDFDQFGRMIEGKSK